MQIRPFLLMVFLLAANFSAEAQRYLQPVFSSVLISEDIAYGSNLDFAGDPVSLELDFFEPDGDALLARPLLVYLHGGGFVDSNQNRKLIHIRAYCDSLARRGYAVASVDYRLDSAINNRAVVNAMHDARAAVRFFRKNASTYRIDTNQIFIAGESAGAVTALAVSYVDKLTEVGSPATPPLAIDLSVEGASGNSGYGSGVKAALCLCGGTQVITGEAMFDTSAIESAADPALLMVHGTADFFIPILYSLNVAIRATNVGLPNLYFPMPGAGHCPWFFPLPDSWAYLDTLIDYTVPFLHALIDAPVASVNYSIDDAQAITIHPNPSTGLFKFEASDKQALGEISIYNAAGILVFQQIENMASSVLDISFLPLGRYHVLIRRNSGTYEYSVIRQ